MLNYDVSGKQFKRYHWCKTQLLGYADDTNTYYIVPDVTNSTKLIMNSNSVVNRLDYDHLGYLRNKTTDPQVELLWRQYFYDIDCNSNYLFNNGLEYAYYMPILGIHLSISEQSTTLNKHHEILQEYLFTFVILNIISSNGFVGQRMFMSGCGGERGSSGSGGGADCCWTNTDKKCPCHGSDCNKYYCCVWSETDKICYEEYGRSEKGFPIWKPVLLGDA